MGIRLPEVMVHAKQIMRRRSSQHTKQHGCGGSSSVIRKGHFAVYVGNEEKSKRFVVPISYLKHPLFQALLSQAEEEFGFDCPAGTTGLIVPCAEHEFINLTSRINHSAYF